MIEIVCHRGANEYAPENTFAAAQKCIDWGMDYVEVDVNTSKDGVLYVFHGPELERTTNGTGRITDLTSEEVDTLDAGSWFSPEFVGERIPRLDAFLRWIKGKAKVFFDVKMEDPQPVIELVYKIGLEQECFFWFGSQQATVRFRELDRQLALKINVKKAEDVEAAVKELGANIVEVGLADMGQKLLDACRKYGVKIMVFHPHKDIDAFRQILQWGIEMANVDHGDLFARIARESLTNA
jgi:glycerophosphoryl diester phosphodiesterase